jgi:hypothetical protein
MGFGGGDHSRLVMSQRVNDVPSITQRMFRDGLWKNTAAEADCTATRVPSTAARAASERIGRL